MNIFTFSISSFVSVWFFFDLHQISKTFGGLFVTVLCFAMFLDLECFFVASVCWLVCRCVVMGFESFLLIFIFSHCYVFFNLIEVSGQMFTWKFLHINMGFEKSSTLQSIKGNKQGHFQTEQQLMHHHAISNGPPGDVPRWWHHLSAWEVDGSLAILVPVVLMKWWAGSWGEDDCQKQP